MQNNNPITSNLLHNANAQAGVPTNAFGQSPTLSFLKSKPMGTPSQPNTGLLPRLAPVAGQIGGGIAGGLGGTALATALLPEETALAPETLGLSYLPSAIAFIGGILGGGAGQGAGKVVENVASKQPAFKDVAKNVGEGALSQGLAEGAGQVIGRIGSKLGGPLLNSAARLFAGQAPVGAVSPDVARYVTQAGENNLNNAANISKVFTGNTAKAGENEALNTKFVESNLGNKKISLRDFQPSTAAAGAGKATPVDISKLGAKAQAQINQNASTNFVQNLIEKNSLSGLPEEKAVQTNINAILTPYKNLNKLAPTDALKIQRDVSSLASDAAKAGKTDLSNTYNTISDEIVSRLGMDDIKVGADALNQHADNLFNAISPLNSKVAQNVSDEIKGLNNPSLSDIRNIEAKWVEISKANNAATKTAATNFGATAMGTAGKAVRNIGSAITGGPVGAAGLIANTLPSGADTALSRVASKLGAKATTGTPFFNNPLSRTLSKLPANYPKALGAIGGVLSNVQNLQPAAVGLTGGTNMQGAGTPAGAGMPGAAGAAGTGADMSTLGQQAAQNVSTPILLMELAAMTDPLIFQQMGGASTLQSLLKPVTAAQTSENALQTLLGANAQGQIGGQNSPFAQAGGAQGKLGGAGAGLVSRLFGGGETSAYGQQAQQLQNQINQALNQAGLSNVNLQLPQITQSPQAAQAQYNLLQSILQPLASGGQIPQNVLQTISQQ